MSISMDRAFNGGVVGLLATAAMSAVILAGRAVGALWTPPPEEITSRVEEKANVRHRLPEPAFHLSWLVAHLGYGTALGVLYSLSRRRLPSSPAAAGLLYGAAVWAGSYLGLMPVLRLYPPPQHDRLSRTAVMIVAHAVYGLALAVAEPRLLGRQAETLAGRLRSTTERLRVFPLRRGVDNRGTSGMIPIVAYSLTQPVLGSLRRSRGYREGHPDNP